ncbi:MAG: oligosaccharide flippase family protein [Verrucomicrobiae bacterium]|nr:oligosaccharide flippase family protein [Verrucomicrobiae bacterium]MCB1085445.1 oligosaccharide flippase family protein [Verrucomicrobiae bacterium]
MSIDATTTCDCASTRTMAARLSSLASGKFVRSLLMNGLNVGGSQLIRLAGNLILTRLLFPEVFGLMALVSVFLIGLEMFSDFGVGASVVQRRSEPDTAFLQTAWTIQAFRGIVLWLAASVAAWPLSAWYGEPRLAWVLPVAALNLAVCGFKSPAIHLCARHLRHGALTKLDLVCAVTGLCVSIVLAASFRSVWSLVGGGIVASLLSLILSWRLPDQVPIRFRWSRESRRELAAFGRWIFVATVFTFLAGHGDRLLLGKFLTLSELGIYTVAFFFAQSVTSFVMGLSYRTLFPIFSRLEPGDATLGRCRMVLLGGALLPLGGFLIGGPSLIEWLYDDRYLAAGSLLQWLALGASAATLRVMAEPVLLARGDSFSRMILGICEALLVLGSGTIGGSLGGFGGFVVGYVVGQFLTLVPAALLLNRHGVWHRRDDLAYLAAVLCLAIAGWSLHPPVIIAG